MHHCLQTFLEEPRVVQFYCANKANIQKAVTDVATAEDHNSDAALPTLADVQALALSILGHGPIMCPEVGKMMVSALRAQCTSRCGVVRGQLRDSVEQGAR